MSMATWQLEEIRAQWAAAGKPYYEFWRVPSMNIGLYVLPAGGTDPQQPHAEDELYYVLAGRAIFVSGDDARPVGPGSIIYVAARVPHRFQAIEEELSVLVVFASHAG